MQTYHPSWRSEMPTFRRNDGINITFVTNHRERARRKRNYASDTSRPGDLNKYSGNPISPIFYTVAALIYSQYRINRADRLTPINVGNAFGAGEGLTGVDRIYLKVMSWISNEKFKSRQLISN